MEFAVIVCDYLGCAKATFFNPNMEKIPYPRCAGCKRNYYCSADCCAKAWKTTHKLTCKTVKPCIYKDYINGVPDVVTNVCRDHAMIETGVYVIMNITDPKTVELVVDFKYICDMYMGSESKMNPDLLALPYMATFDKLMSDIIAKCHGMKLTHFIVLQIRGLFIVHSGK